MSEGAFRALVRVDLRRFRRQLLGGVGFTGAALVLFTLAGHATRETAASVLLGASVYYLLWPPMMAITDRLDGGMELLSSLPIPAATIAWARLAAISVAALPVAVHVVVAFVLFLGPLLGFEAAPGSSSAVFLLAWALAVGVGGVGAGVILRWGVEAAGRWPVIVASLGLLAVVLLGERYGGALRPVLSGLLARAGVPVVVGVMVASVAVASMALAHHLIQTGLMRFQPERGRSRG